MYSWQLEVDIRWHPRKKKRLHIVEIKEISSVANGLHGVFTYTKFGNLFNKIVCALLNI
jgi:hypothetical protein